MVIMIGLFLVFPDSRIIPLPYNLFGVVLFFLGAYIASAAKKAFQSSGTPMMPSDTAGKLHRDGFFKYSRNPMYLGIGIGLLGFAVFLSSYFNFLFPILFLIIMDRYFIPREEAILTEAFGSEYINYKSSVRRWI
jgi:protein-S-isoprenylcysteine O-methyltransferase Ste14